MWVSRDVRGSNGTPASIRPLDLNYGERYYDSAIMRWTQPDPLLNEGDIRQANRYACACGDPVNSSPDCWIALRSASAESVIRSFRSTKSAFRCIFYGTGAAIPLGGPSGKDVPNYEKYVRTKVGARCADALYGPRSINGIPVSQD